MSTRRGYVANRNPAWPKNLSQRPLDGPIKFQCVYCKAGFTQWFPTAAHESACSFKASMEAVWQRGKRKALKREAAQAEAKQATRERLLKRDTDAAWSQPS